jgi:ubiquinone/menaquinone biosynthesis C-methylase UbiE
MAEVNLLGAYPRARRDYDKRARGRTAEDVRLAKEFGREFFDGPRGRGYGGYRYDGRWKEVAKRMRDYYRLEETAAVLDVGCAKGFMLYDFKELMPNAVIAGIDISRYGIEHAMEGVKPFLREGDAKELPYADGSFDLVISINTIHNLPEGDCRRALREIQRVTRKHAFITVDSWRTEAERERLMKWNLTALTYMHVEDWKKLFSQVGYTGDYHWFIAE